MAVALSLGKGSSAVHPAGRGGATTRAVVDIDADYYWTIGPWDAFRLAGSGAPEPTVGRLSDDIDSLRGMLVDDADRPAVVSHDLAHVVGVLKPTRFAGPTPSEVGPTGRLIRTVNGRTLSAHLSGSAADLVQPPAQERALPFVDGQGERRAVLRGCFVSATEPAQQVGPCRRERAVAA
jgi:hypothetical protein